MAELNIRGAMGESLAARAKPWLAGWDDLDEYCHEAMLQDLSEDQTRNLEYQRGVSDGGKTTREMLEKAHREQTTQLLRSAAHQRAVGRIQGSLTTLAVLSLILPLLLHWWSGS